MRVLIINAILHTAEKGVISKMKSIKDTMIYDLCLGFKSKGCDVVLAAAEDYKPICEEEYPFEVIFFKTSYKGIFQPAVLPLMPTLFRYIKANKGNFDAIISSELFSICSLFAALISPEKTIIWQELGSHNRKMRKIPSKIWYNIITPLFMRKCTVACRSEIARSFVSKYHKNITEYIIGHGVNESIFIPKLIKNDNLIVIAQLIPRKNIYSIIEKFSLFIDTFPEYKKYKLYIAGRGPLEEKLKEEAKELGKQDSIVFLGHILHDELNNYLSTAKCLLTNTCLDLNMVSIFEAVASATPVITNLTPYSSYDIKSNNLGVAKNNWDENDIKEIIVNNEYYVNNCYNYRDNITVTASVDKFIRIIAKYIIRK
ncbi:MAG: glycosyltransferase [Bacteroidales bacterium]